VFCCKYSCGSGYNNFASEMECTVTCGAGQDQPVLQYPAQPAGQYPAQPAGQYPAQPAGQYPAQPAGQYPAQPYAPYPTPFGPSNPGTAFRPPYNTVPRPEAPTNGGSGSLWDTTEYVPLLSQDQFPAFIQNHQLSLGKLSPSWKQL
jgi:hypothetical protein